MSSDWEITTLGAVTDWMSGGTPKKDESNYWGGDIPWISANTMYGTRYADSDLRLTSEGLANGSRLAPKDAVLLLVRGGALHTRIPVGIAERPVAFNQDVKALIAKTDCVRPWFLLSWLMGKERFLLDSVVEYTGIGAGKLDTKRMQSLALLLPPLDQQDEIIKVAKALDDRINLLRETNKTLEAIAQALFKSWFVDFDPVRAKMEGKQPEGMDEATAALFPDSFEESELGLVPQGWQVQVVGELVVPKRGKSITKSKCVDGSIPVVAGGLEPAYFHNQSNVSGPVVTISASGANAGFVRLYHQDIWASDCSYISAEQTDAIYFWYVFLKFSQEKIYFMQQGAAQPHIYPSDLMRLNLANPRTKRLRNSFDQFVSPLFERIGLASEKIQTLSNLRDTLLPRMISGQLRLPEAEAEIEALTA